MKRILFLAGLVIVGTAIVCGAALIYSDWSSAVSSSGNQTAAACPPPRKLTPLPNIDALAARMPHDQDIYRSVRDQALANYAKLHPSSYPYSEDSRAALRLIAYLAVWNDFMAKACGRN